MFSICFDAMKRWCKALFVVAAVVFMSWASAEAYDFPLFEDFEQAGSVFDVKEGSGWGVVGSHGPWVNFAGDRHLDNNIHEAAQERGTDAPGDYRAVFSEFIAIPVDVSNPVLFFWYKSRMYKYGDRIYVDILIKDGDTVHVDTKLILTRWDNTREYYKWKKLSLDDYKGKEIKIAFRQAVSRWGRSRIFVVDNIAVCSADIIDGDEDGIPDNLDYSPNGDLLPPPEGFTAINSAELQMDLSWLPLDRHVHPVAGYKIYRRSEGSSNDVLLNYYELLPPETDSFSDDAIRNATNYTYKIVAISSDGQRGVTAESNSAYVNYNLTPFPYEESFDSVEPGFAIPDDSGWAISEAHGEWDNFSGNYHLDSNPIEADQVLEWGSRHIVRASMKNRVHVPDDAVNPSLSFWYKINLRTLEADDLGYDDFWNYNDDFNFLTGLLYGDRIYVDVHFVLYRFWGDPIEMVHRYVRTYTPEDNTNDYIWDSIPLHHYRGTEIWVDFRKKTGCSGVGSAFVMDDFRIGEEPDVDDNGNGIPDDYEAPMGEGKLPYVRDFKAELTDVGSVKISWTPVPGNPALDPAGYRIYRQMEGEEGFLQLTDTPLPYEFTQWTDTTMTGDGIYSYYVIGVTTDGVEGYPTQTLSVDVVIPAPVIVSQPEDQDATDGDPVSFKVEAKGLHLTYQWLRNGTPISDAPNLDTYTIQVSDLSDHKARFSCRITNMAGKAETRDAVLTMYLAKPVIKIHPLSVTEDEGKRVEFSVEATGEFLTYQWQKKSSDNAGSTPSPYVNIPGATQETYVIESLPYTGYDLSSFRCVVSNRWNEEFFDVPSKSVLLDVKLAAPTITSQSSSTRVPEESNVTFSVETTGTDVRYQWFRNGEPITGAISSSYALQDVQLEDDASSFVCLVDNRIDNNGVEEGGEQKSLPITLNIDLLEPVLKPLPEITAATERDKLTLSIQAEGRHLTYQWFKDGDEISGATQSEYVIESLPYHGYDGAVFKCRVSNAWNGQSHQVESSTTLDVKLAPPQISEGGQPETITVIERLPSTFTVKAIGTDLTYQWYLNGEAVEGAIGESWKREKTSLEDDESEVFCRVSNTLEKPEGSEGGSVDSALAILNVDLAAPEIKGQPVDRQIMERGSGTISVTVLASYPSFKWLKGGQLLEGVVSQSIDEETNYVTSTIELKNVAYEDDGAEISCLVSNQWKEQYFEQPTEKAILDVILSPPLIDTHPVAEKEVTERSPLELQCSLIGSQLTLQWFVGEEAITGATQTKLYIEKTPLAWNGKNITCVASNKTMVGDVEEGGLATTNPTALTVKLAPPEIKEQPVATTTTERDSCEFSVKSIGSHMTFRWLKGGQLLKGVVEEIYDEEEEVTTSTITLNNVIYEDNGAEISCHISNDWEGQHFDKVSSKVLFTVLLAPPLIKKHPESRRVDEGTDISFAVIPIGSELAFQWYKDGVPIAGSTQSDLAFTNVPHDRSGAYHCVVLNDAGSLTSQVADLIVVIDPKPELTLEGPDERATNDFLISLSGYALAPGTSIQSITAANDRYPGQSFGITVDASGAIIGEIPLELGLNTITLTMVMKDPVTGEITTTTKVMTVTAGTASLPVISITSPASGTVVTTDQVTFAGKIRSSLPPEQIRVIHDENLTFPAGAGGEYEFSFEHSGLIKGHNTLKVTAETPFGNVSAQTVVVYTDEGSVAATTPPAIEVFSPLPGRMVTEETVSVKGMARGEVSITSVDVNGVPATLTGSSTQVSYEALIDINAGELATIHITATDATGETGELTYDVGRDLTDPVIEITSQALLSGTDPVNVVENPLPVTGRITEANLAGVAVEMRNLKGDVLVRTQPEITPAQGDAFDFATEMVLLAGSDAVLFVEAWDMAGNRTDRSFVIHHEGGVSIEVIAPVDGSRKTVSADTMDLPVTLRIPGVQETDQVAVLLDGVPLTELTRAGATINGTANVAATEGPRELSVTVHSTDGTLLARTRSEFFVANLDKVALKVIRQEPVNNAEGVEPNAFIAFYFNKEVNPAELSFKVYETVHGKSWRTPEKGADITEISVVAMEELHRSNEEVPGGVSVLPGNTMVAFYPERDFGYTATVTVKLLHKGEELARSIFNVRPRPTFIKGMLSTQFTEPLDGLKVVIPELGRTAISSDGGNFAFGFGDKADEVIPPGKYRLVVNPGMEKPGFGTVETWANIQEGMLNQLPVLKVPVLNPDEPFRLIESGKADNLLAGGELTLNLSASTLYFPDGMRKGSVHTQFTPLDKIGCGLSPVAVPHWVYAIQPMGIEVRGTVDLTVKMPKLYGTHDYVENLGDRVMLVGYDPDAMQLIPVGVGSVDKDNRKVTSERPVAVSRLDYLGYAIVEEAKQPLLKEYADGNISMAQLTFELQ